MLIALTIMVFIILVLLYVDYQKQDDIKDLLIDIKKNTSQ
jgi:hypothetical protein